jgi:chromate reductase, NAD(P)H dehydrogenase (quinone)
MHVLLISGSTRRASSNSMVLQRLHELDHPDVITDYYDRLRDVPAFVPDEQSVPAVVTDVLTRMRTADAVLFSTPEYAGGLPGTLKNLLDWTVGAGALYCKPVAWLDVANPGRGHGARAQLETVLTYVAARIITAACVHVTLHRTDTGTTLADDSAQVLAGALSALAGNLQEDPQ